MKFKDLTLDEREIIVTMYSDKYRTPEGLKLSRAEVQSKLSDMFDVSERSIRTWARELGLGLMSHSVDERHKILIYDIETSRIPAMVWWTGKQYVNHEQLKGEAKIITVAWKWLGEDEIFHLTWDKDQCDKKLVESFLKEYNRADLVVGQNNDRFDNRWVNARAMKHGLEFNNFVRSFDIMKETKRLFRLPSYSMAYITKFLGITLKQGHEGILMWDMIQNGTPEQQAEYLQKMVEYNIGDIVSTEEMFLKLRKHMGNKIHFGTLDGKEKFTCPNCGSDNIELERVTSTPAGTLQYIMKCKDDGVRFKLSGSNYVKFLTKKINGGN